MSKWYHSTVVLLLVLLNVTAMATLYGAIPEPVDYTPPPRVYLAQNCKAPDCDYDFLDNVAWCESKWMMVQNSTSSAFGFFQIIKGTEQTTEVYKNGGSRLEPYDNIDMGIELYLRDGIFPWMESRPCWHWRYQGAVYGANIDQCIGSGCDS